MSKQKSVFVTAIVAVMLGIIVFAAYRLYMIAFVVIVAALSGVGFGFAAVCFCRWLEQSPFQAEEAVEPLTATPLEEKPDKEKYDYESIREEVQGA